MFDVVIINDDLERAYEELKDILTDVSEDRTQIVYRHFTAQKNII